MGVAAHREGLLAAGHHLMRGVLLHGRLGAGETRTVRCLRSVLTGVTAFVLSGQGPRLVARVCTPARHLQPSPVDLEDVDPIPVDGSSGPMGNPLTFEVLNQIDELGDDADVTFLLTTSRVDILECALSEHPGRVDAAVEIAVPDRAGRTGASFTGTAGDWASTHSATTRGAESAGRRKAGPQPPSARSCGARRWLQQWTAGPGRCESRPICSRRPRKVFLPTALGSRAHFSVGRANRMWSRRSKEGWEHGPAAHRPGENEIRRLSAENSERDERATQRVFEWPLAGGSAHRDDGAMWLARESPGAPARRRSGLVRSATGTGGSP